MYIGLNIKRILLQRSVPISRFSILKIAKKCPDFLPVCLPNCFTGLSLSLEHCHEHMSFPHLRSK